jgi:anti-sigma factor RsiW
VRLQRPWWRRRKQLSCAEVAAVLQGYLDGELDVADRPTVAAHLDVCRDCGLEEVTFRHIKAALVEPSTESVDPAVLERLRQFGSELPSRDQPA